MSVRGLHVVFSLFAAAGCQPQPAEHARPSGIRETEAEPRPAPKVKRGDAKPLRRGLNLANALDAPREGEWGVVLTENHFECAARAGFDHVRLPVRFSAHALEQPPYTIDESFFARVDWAIARALEHSLSIVVDMHHYDELHRNPEQHEARFVALWEQIAARYAKQPDTVVFELLNEPHDALTPERWNALVQTALPRVRAGNEKRRIVIDSAWYAAASALKPLKLPDDPHLLASFHMYEPLLFTHQGAHWMSAEYQTVGVVFPGPPETPLEPLPSARAVDWVKKWFEGYNTLATGRNPGGMQAIEKQFALAASYVENTGRELYVGEFGAIDKADPESRQRYVRAVRAAAEDRGFGWAYWDDGARFKAVIVESCEWIEPLRRALLD